jgi:hypothetical protein
MGLRRGISQSRNVIRTISVLVIVATIPFYILGLGAWALNGGSSSQRPTFTPLGGVGDDGDTGDDDDIATFTPLGSDNEVPTLITPFFTATSNLGGTFTYATPILLATLTPPPTRYLSPTPAPTLAPTNTQPAPPTAVIAPTDVIVPTQPVLIPPTDTPTV